MAVDIFTDERKILVIKDLPINCVVYEHDDGEEYIVVDYEWFKQQVDGEAEANV